jgi:hypothetical protein
MHFWFDIGHVRILGSKHAIILTRATELNGSFNEHLAGKTLYVSEESTFGGSKRDGALIKNIVNNNFINIHPKYGAIYTLRARHNLVFNANLHQHSVMIGQTERRYVCIYPNNKYAGKQTPEAREYFGRLASISPYLIAYYFYFIHNITGVSLTTNPPVTNALVDQKLRTLDSFQRFLLSQLQDCSADEWRQLANNSKPADWYKRYLQWCSEHRVNSYDVVPDQQARALLQVHLAIVIKNNGVRVSSKLDLNRVKFASSLELNRFPMEEVKYDDDDDEPDSQPPPASNAALLINEDSLSQDDRIVQAGRQLKRQKVSGEYARCKFPGCKDRHPLYVLRGADGSLHECHGNTKGRVEWHEAVRSGEEEDGS